MITIGQRAGHSRHDFGRGGATVPAVTDPGMPPQGDDFLRLLGEVTALRRKRMHIGMGVIRGEIDRALCAEVKRTVSKLADYVSYARCGPFLVVAFQRGLFEQLKPTWKDLLGGAPGIRAGVAFPAAGMTTHDLVLAARLALLRAGEMGCDLVAFDEREASDAAASAALEMRRTPPAQSESACDCRRNVPVRNAVITATQAPASSVS